MTERKAALLTIRIGSRVARSLAREAHRRRKTRSEVAREILETELLGDSAATVVAQKEARRQSLLVSGRRSEREVLEFIENTADRKGWR